MTVECWVALCPSCHVVWPVESMEDPRFTSHGKTSCPWLDYFLYDVVYQVASDRVMLYLRRGCPGYERADFKLAMAVMNNSLRARRASTLPCPGDGELAGAVALSESEQAGAWTDEAIRWHKEHPRMEQRWAWAPERSP